MDLDNQFYAKFVALKQRKAGLKTLIAIGGWNDSMSPKYSQMVSDPNKINTFVNSVLAFLQRYGFDGLDLDWEYPATAADKAGLTQLLAALRSAFAPYGYLLTLAVNVGQPTIDAGNDRFIYILYVCMYVCMYYIICIYIYINKYIYISIYYKYTYILCIYVYIFIHSYIYYTLKIVDSKKFES